MKNIWQFSMNVDLVEHLGYPGYRFTWHIRDAAGQMVTHHCEIDGHAMKTILDSSYLIHMANHAFLKFYEDDQARFEALLEAERARYPQITRPDLDSILDNANDKGEDNV